MLCLLLPFIIEEVVTINIIFYQIIGFIIVFGILLTTLSIILNKVEVIDKAIDKVKLIKIPYKILGVCVSVIKMYLIIFMFLILLLLPYRNSSTIKKSILVENIVYKTPVLSKMTNNVINILESIIDLDKSMINGDITINEANLEILDLLLKYNMIDKDIIIDLFNQGKIGEIKDIEKVVLNY